jgi:hypothetical protein
MKRFVLVLMFVLAACTAARPEGAVKRDATPEVGVIGSLRPAPPRSGITTTWLTSARRFRL